MSTRMPLAALLQRHLDARGWNADRLATASGVPRATVYRWVGGGSAAYHWDRLLQAAQALDLPRALTNQLLRAAELPTLDRLAAGAKVASERALVERWDVTTRNNLPAARSSFVGREDEVVAVAARLCEPDTRLLTLTGAGGSGKTRLSLRVARELLDAFPDGVMFVALAAARAPAEALLEIMRVLGVPEAAQQTPRERLAAYLRPRRLLLVLDNLEQIAGLGADVGALLDGAPGLRVLATSRAPLHVYGEHLWPVAPLGLPARDASAAQRAAAPAVTLFAARATAANPAFRLAPVLDAVTTLCARLDGLPLALELAAARSARLTPQELLDSFGSRLDISADGPLDVDARQRTLRAAIAWSYDLLSPAQQALFAQLGVFVGGWTLAAARAVCGGAPVDDLDAELRALTEASLIATDDASEPRWHMLETLREFAVEQLDARGEADATRQRHAAHFHGLGTALPRFSGTRDDSQIEALNSDRDNLRAALDWLSADRPTAAAELTAALLPYWLETGYYIEGAQRMQAAAALGSALPDAVRARILTGLAVCTQTLSDFAAALPLTDEAIAATTAVGDVHSLALLETYRGITAQHSNDRVAAEDWLLRSLAHWRMAEEPLGEARALSELALLHAMYGDAARSAIEAAEADVIYRRTGNWAGLTRTDVDGGLVALMHGDVTRALELLTRGVERAGEGGFAPTRHSSRCYLGLAHLFAGQLDAARDCLTMALRGFADAGDSLFASYSLIGLAGVAGRQGQAERGATLCGAGLAMQAAVGMVMPPGVQGLYDIGESWIRAQLSPEDFAAAFARGQELSRAGAIELALAGATVRAES